MSVNGGFSAPQEFEILQSIKMSCNFSMKETAVLNLSTGNSVFATQTICSDRESEESPSSGTLNPHCLSTDPITSPIGQNVSVEKEKSGCRVKESCCYF